MLNKNSKYTCFILILSVLFIFSSCKEPGVGPSSTGSISGFARFNNSSSHEGITVTLEKTDGLRSFAALSAARSIEQGARSIEAARTAVGVTQTAADGSYTFSDIASGTYTVYASSPNSKERAVAINITVEAGKAVTAANLNLTPVGSITGRILLDGTEIDNYGFLVCVAGTSYMAATAPDGQFTISDIPTGNNYLILVIKGNFTTVWASVSVSGSNTTTMNPNPLSISTTDLGLMGIVWIGELSEPPSNPQTNWAYYNTTTKNSYIWNGSKWDILAAQGGKGEDGIIPEIKDGYWWIGNTNTGVKAEGVDGVTPHIGDNNNWWIGTTDTGIKAIGVDGTTPHIGDNNNWWIGDNDTGIRAEGFDGTTPHVGDNDNWWIGTTDTGIKALGVDGTTPRIGPNNNWWIGDTDTEIRAEGFDGTIPHIGDDGNWWIGDYNTGEKAQGPKGDEGDKGDKGDDASSIYTVAFIPNGGSTVYAVIVKDGEKAEKPQNPTRTGYEFDNWYSDPALTSEYDFDSSVTINILLYANWIINQYTVEFNSNDGSAVADGTVNHGSLLVQPANPTKDGFGFDGWYTGPDFTVPYNFEAPVTGGFTLYAKWSTTPYTVTFNSMEGSAVAIQPVLPGFFAEQPDDPVRTGFIFSGWHTSDTVFNETTLYDFDLPVSGNITLYAWWRAAFVVTFNSWGNTVGQQYVEPDMAASFPYNPPDNPPFSFGGWYTDADTNTAWDINAPVTANITLYARWQTEDDPDFDDGTVIARALTVSSAAEWTDALITINSIGHNKNYIINFAGDFSLPGRSSHTFGIMSSLANIVVAIRGTGEPGNRIITLSSGGKLLELGGTQTVILRDITLEGRGDNTEPLVRIMDGSTLEMKGAARIFGNTNRATSYAYGGGVYIQDGTFTMYDNAIVIGNTVYSSGNYSYGGGVYMRGGTFSMRGNAKVASNTVLGASSYGGGVCVSNSGTFTMQDNASVSDNSISDGSSKEGGGVYVQSGTFTLRDNAAVSGNRGATEGGGVRMVNGLFIMRDSARISGNITGATGVGAGVYNGGATFRFGGGIIYGNDGGDNKNEVPGTDTGRGHAFYSGVNTLVYGSFEHNDFTPVGSLETRYDSTISVVDGELVIGVE